jgi:hypothetical protein
VLICSLSSTNKQRNEGGSPGLLGHAQEEHNNQTTPQLTPCLPHKVFIGIVSSANKEGLMLERSIDGVEFLFLLYFFLRNFFQICHEIISC